MDRKKIFIIAGIIMLILAGIGAYFYFSKKPLPSNPIGALFPGEGRIVPKPPRAGDSSPDEGVFPPSNQTFPRLYQLHKTPVAGVGFAEQVSGKKKTFFARSIERGVGHIFETNLETLRETRISNETYPGIAEAFFGDNGRSLVIRTLDEQEGVAIKTRALQLNIPSVSFSPTSEEQTPSTPPQESYFPDYIPHVSVAEDGSNKIFYLENSLGTARGSISNLKNSGISTIFNSAFTEWLPQLPNQRLATITTKPSHNIPGHLYFVDTQNSSLSKILSNINGLTTSTNRDGKFVLYTEVVNKTPNLMVYDVVKKESLSLSLKTLSEKCAWSTKNTGIAYCAAPEQLPSARYPDQWYQGTVSFSDTMWKIDAKTGFIEKVFTPEKYSVPAMDIINPVVSGDEAYLVFIDKKTNTPWLFFLREELKVFVPSTPATLDGGVSR